ncbi:MAG: flagellar brake protein [Thermodesulfobacteriota bacterium]|nr:flagellar brake protein [Thermodesulfobacteriota bacterium]
MLQEKRTNHGCAGMRLHVELGSQLSIQIEGMEEHFESILVGLEPPGYLIVQMPLLVDVGRHFEEGNRFVVRYFCLGNAYEFRSTVLASIVKPFRLIFLSYPETVVSLNLRKSRRISCYIPAVAQFDGREVKGVISDISHEGCQFNIKVPPGLKPLQVHVVDDVRLSLTVLGMGGIQHFQGKVRNTNQNGERIVLGIEVEDLDAEMAHKISTHIGGVP